MSQDVLRGAGVAALAGMIGPGSALSMAAQESTPAFTSRPFAGEPACLAYLKAVRASG